MTCIAVVMTSFNRKPTTIQAIEALKRQRLPAAAVLRICLADDGSHDGTADAVLASHPEVIIAHGDGSLYWTGGTLLAESIAMQKSPDYVLWLNDDVTLDDDAVKVLLEAAERADIVVGSVTDPGSNEIVYGGFRCPLARCVFPMERVVPDGTVQPIDTMNGNVVLVTARARELVGPLDKVLRHNMADIDYGRRATQIGLSVVLAPRSVGICKKNLAKQAWSEPTRPLFDRLRGVMSTKGCPPRAWLRFTRRHCGWKWPRYFLGPYLRALFPSVMLDIRRLRQMHLLNMGRRGADQKEWSIKTPFDGDEQSQASVHHRGSFHDKYREDTAKRDADPGTHG